MVRNNNIDNLLLCTILHAVHGNLYRLTLSRRTGTRHIEYSISACGRRCSSVCPNSIRTFPGTCRLSLLFSCLYTVCRSSRTIEDLTGQRLQMPRSVEPASQPRSVCRVHTATQRMALRGAARVVLRAVNVY